MIWTASNNQVELGKSELSWVCHAAGERPRSDILRGRDGRGEAPYLIPALDALEGQNNKRSSRTLPMFARQLMPVGAPLSRLFQLPRVSTNNREAALRILP